MPIFNISNFKKRGVILPPAELEHAASELNIFRENIKSAISFLKGRQKPWRLFPGRKVPLFLIIGADSAGKSSLLTQSGLGLIDAARQLISNPISTRYCHFWFSEHEIFVDTAGSYTTASSADISVNLAWRGLIKLLYSYKNKFPLSGLLIAIDLPTLSQEGANRQQILNNIKQRIYEIAKYAKGLPMFIVFTKCDLIAGFNDFFNDLSNEERAQPFGINFQETIGKTLPIHTFEGKFSLLLQRLSDHMFFRLHQEMQIDKCRLIKDFPLQMESLKNTIAEIINEIPSNAQTAVHGIYFTSSLQKGVPIDYLPTQFDQAEISKNQHFCPRYPQDLSSHQPYFIAELFKEIIQTAKKKIKIKAKFGFKPLVFAFGTAVIGAVFLGLFLYHNHIQNMRSLVRVKLAMQENSVNERVGDETNDPEKALLLLKKIKAELGGKLLQPGILESRELKQLYSQAAVNYRHALAVKFLPELQSDLESILNDPKDQNAFELYSALKTYLMLGNVVRLNKDHVQKWFCHHWDRDSMSSKESIHLKKTYLNDAMLNKLSINTDKQTIETARSALSAMNLGELVYSIVKNESDSNWRKISVKANSASMLVFGIDREIPSRFFSNSGFPEINKKISLAAKDLMLGGILPDARSLHLYSSQAGFQGAAQEESSSLESIDKLVQKAQALYLAEYIKVWRNVVSSAKIKEFTGIKQMIQGLHSLAADDSSLLGIIKSLKIHAPQNSEFSGWQGVNIGELQRILQNSADYLNAHDGRGGDEKTSWVIARNIMQNGVLPQELESLRSFAKRQPKPLKKWLLTLADNTWHFLLQNSRSYIDNIWSSTVWPKYRAVLQNKYPLHKSSKEMISLSEFTDFFGRRGTMSNFFNSYLLSFVDVRKPYWVWKRIADRSIEIPQTALEIFIRAELIKRMFYAGNAMQPKINFTLRRLAVGPGVRSFSLMLDGQPVTAQRGGKISSDNLIWPGPQPGEVTVSFINTAGRASHFAASGPWAWFKVLDRANLQATGNPKRFDLLFDLDGNAIKYALYADNAINPFIPEIIGKFRCVEKL